MSQDIYDLFCAAASFLSFVILYICSKKQLPRTRTLLILLSGVFLWTTFMYVASLLHILSSVMFEANVKPFIPIILASPTILYRLRQSWIGL